METTKRTFVKAILWNVLGLSMMSIVGLLMTGSISTGGTIALINTIIGLTVYIFYERLWSRILWGRVTV